VSWSYDSSTLNTTTVSGRLNSVRLLVGDTNYNDQLLQDEEVIFALDQRNDNIYYAASWCARVISSKYAREVDLDLDGEIAASMSDLAKNYSKLADSLDLQGKKQTGSSLGAAAGGILLSQIEAARDLTDRNKSAFSRDKYKIDNPRDGSYLYD
jgi:hypothetical protein